jgi:SOS response regulatory protein OraA/RecX
VKRPIIYFGYSLKVYCIMLYLEYYSDNEDDSIQSEFSEENESVYNVFKATEAILLSRGYSMDDIQDYYNEIQNRNILS